MKNKKKKGFTLVELVIVIAIIGILAAIAIPKYQQSKKQAAISAHKANVHMLESAATMRLVDGVDDEGVTWPKAGDSDKYVQNWPKIPNGLKNAGTNYSVTITKDGTITVTPGYEAETKTDNATN